MGVSDFVHNVTHPGDFFNDLGDTVSGAWDDFTGVSSAKSANKTNIKLQRQQQDWEEMMANTAVQRRQKDLQAAGINPLLAAAGSGADVPNVSPARVENVQPGGMANTGEKAISSAFGLAQMALATSAARKNNAEANVTEQTSPAVIAAAGQNVEKLKAEIDNIQNDTDLKYWHVALTKIQGRLGNMDYNQRNVMYPLIQRELQIANEKASLGLPEARKQAEAWQSVLGTWAAYAERIIPTVNSAIGAGALGQISKFITPGAKVKGGLPKYIKDQMEKGGGSRYGSFDKSTGEIFGR